MPVSVQRLSVTELLLIIYLVDVIPVQCKFRFFEFLKFWIPSLLPGVLSFYFIEI